MPELRMSKTNFPRGKALSARGPRVTETRNLWYMKGSLENITPTLSVQGDVSPDHSSSMSSDLGNFGNKET